MTEEYKKDVLDYMTGKLTPGNQTSNYFRDNEAIQNNLTQKLTEKGITPSFSFKILRSDFTSNYLIYDTYFTSNNELKGYIAILNQKGEVLDILTTYESGTLIEAIYSLEYDENGYIYGIDLQSTSNKYRIIQLNNIAIPIGNNYICRLRSSYFINTDFEPSYLYIAGTSAIKKVPGEAKYYIFGYDPNQWKTKLIEFSNIVGMPLEWNYYIGSTISSYINASDFIIQNTDGNITIDFFYLITGEPTSLRHEYFDGSTLSSKTTTTIPNACFDLRVQDEKNVYLSGRKNNSNGTYTLYGYKWVNGSISTIFDYTIPTIDVPRFYITLLDGILFTQSQNTHSAGILNIICGAYYNNTFIKSPPYEHSIEEYLISNCNVQKIFNLYVFLVQEYNTVYHPNIVIYDNQYNGYSYQNYNSLIPAHSEIYSNGYIQFARDLYNKQVFENQTLAVVNVPFNYLNDMTISPSNLLGQTMTTLVSDKRDITKNKYENVYINFLNKLNVIDEDINQYYPLTANYINKNINVGTSANYNISKLTKVRINFSTPQIININWTKYYSYYKTTFEVQIEDEIPTSIDFISEDETTTYITKEYHFQKNKNYMISEKVRIGESLQREELMYNNQNVLYDNNQVMVYTKE